MINILNKFRESLTGPFLYWAASMIANVLNWLFNLQLGRTLSREEFGLISVFVAFQYLIAVPASALSTTVTRFTAYYIGKGEREKHFYFFRQYWWLSWMLGLLFLGGFLVTQSILANFFGISEQFLLFIFAGIFIPLFLVSFEKGVLSGQLAFGFLGFLLIVESVTKLFFITFLKNLPISPLTLSILSLPISVFLVWFISLVITRSFHPMPVRKEIKKNTNLDDTYRFLANSFFAGLGIVLIYNIDILLVKHFFSATEAGVYSTLSLLGKMLFFGAGSLIGLLVPLTARAQARNESGRKAFLILFSIVSFVGIGIWLTYLIVPEFIVKLLLTEKGLVVIPYLSKYSLGMLFLVLSYCFSSYSLARRNYLPSRLIILAAIIQAFLILFFHNSLDQVVNIVSTTLFGLLISVVVADLFNITPGAISNNFNSLLSLIFEKINFSKEQTGKRILIFNWRDLKHVRSGGAEVYIEEISSRLVKHGYSVTLFTSNDGQNLKYEKVKGVNIIRKGGFVTVYFWAIVYYVLKLRKNFDLIIDSENGIPFFAPFFSRKPIILLVHHVHQDVFFQSLVPPFSWIANFLESFLMPKLYRNCQVVAVSNSTAEELAGQINVQQAVIISNGVDTKIYKPTKKSIHPSICYVGRLKKYKSVDVLLYAFEKLLREYPKAKLVIAGDGDLKSSFISGEGNYRQRLEDIAKDLGIINNVSFLGKVSESKKIGILGSSWIMVHPSSQEGWGITCLEANACKTPVLASNVAGLKDAVKEGHSGFLFDYGNYSELYRKMSDLIVDKTLRESLSNSARNWSELYSWDIQAQKYDYLIQEMLSNKINIVASLSLTNFSNSVNNARFGVLNRS